MQDIFDSIHNIPYAIGYLILDFLEWVLSIFPALSLDLQGLVNSMPVQILSLLVYCNVFDALAIVASAYGIRAVLMLFGR